MVSEEVFSKLKEYASALEQEVENQKKKAEKEKIFREDFGYAMEMHAKAAYQTALDKLYNFFPELKEK